MSLTPRSVENIKTNAQAAMEILLSTLDDATEEIREGASQVRGLEEQLAQVREENDKLHAECSSLEEQLRRALDPPESAHGALAEVTSLIRAAGVDNLCRGVQLDSIGWRDKMVPALARAATILGQVTS